MLNCVALLPTDKLDKADEAYQLFARPLPKQRIRDDPVTKEAFDKLFADFTAFKNGNNCTEIDIDFIGCWSVLTPIPELPVPTYHYINRDTVNSVGIIRPIKLKFTANNKRVRVFRHALALDEHRARFKPNFWGRQKPNDATGDAPQTDVEEVSDQFDSHHLS
jgi:hypothetical protein